MSRGESIRHHNQKVEHLMTLRALAVDPLMIGVERQLLESSAMAARDLERRGATVEAAALQNAIADYREAKGVR